MGLLELDQLARAWVVGHRVSAFDPILLGFSLAGIGGFVWYLAGAALAATRQISWRAFGQLVLSLFLTWVLVERVMKPLIGRDRPFLHGAPIPIIGYTPDGPSFPSGHAAVAFAAAFVLSRVAPRGRLVWWPLAVVIAYSRVYLGVHYPLDVACGAAAGVICAFVVMRLTRSAP